MLRISRLRGHRLRSHGFSGLVVALAVGLIGAPAAAQAAPSGTAPGVQAQGDPARGAAMVAQAARPDRSADKVMKRPDAVRWPSAASGEVAVAPTAGGATTRVGDLAVAASWAGNARLARAGAPLAVQVFDRNASTRASVAGPIIGVRGGPSDGPVRLSVSYADFAHAFGGDFGSRLRLVKLPACAVTTPDRAECRKKTFMDSRNDTEALRVSVTVDPAPQTGGFVMAMDAGDASAQGDYKATTLSPSSSWSTALSSGGFAWSYPIRAPKTPSGMGPQVALSYSSQSVDGRTSATNNQGSWLGEGFSYEPGYIERRYKPCADDGHDTSADQCWGFANGTLMLQGHSGDLVKINDDLWKISTDDGSKVERLTGATNGDDNGEHWKVTTTDGTQYFFGLNRLPGYSTNKEETKSTWTVPVYGDDAGEPCNQTSGFTNSYCDQAWRWNLDYVVDPRGNVMSYFYDRETNYYARGGRTDINGVAYTRGGSLARVDYGQRDGQVYSTNAPARVVFTTAERCLPAGAVDCDPQDLTAATAASWPDIPFDLICAPNTHCTTSQVSPTFFTRKRVTKIQTEVRSGSSWAPVESWALEHAFKANDDNSRTLWLSKITHAGRWGGSTITLPAVELEGIQLPNRVDSSTDGIGPLVRYRLAGVKTESGAQITVNYKPVDCVAGALPAEGSSMKRCFPLKWNPFGGGEENKVTDWFHKYVVDTLVEDDLVGGNPDKVTSYDYVGPAAWRKSEPDGLTKPENLTWSDWRGYGQVTVRTGTWGSLSTRVDHFLLRGLSGGKIADGSTPTVTVTDSTGTVFTDHNELSGHELETIVYNGPDIVSKTINQPWSQTTQTQTETWGTKKATMVRTEVVRTLTALAGPPASWRETKTVTSYDGWGRVTTLDDLGDVAPGQDADDLCTRTWYVDSPAKYLYSQASRMQVVSVKCAVPNPDLATKLVTAKRTSYDLQNAGVAPTTGVITRTESLDRFDGTNILYVTDFEALSVDVYGRPLSVKDARGFPTLNEYTETDGLTTQIKVTNALTHVSTSTQDRAYGVPTAKVDANLKRTDLTYDALGRLTEVWLADRSKALGATANVKYAYLIRNDKTSVTTTQKINNDGTYRNSYELFDGLLRSRQTQQPGPGGNWLLGDTIYNSVGQVAQTNEAYLAIGTAGDMPIVVADGGKNGQKAIAYDGAGRVILETTLVAGNPKWSTVTSYDGDRVHLDPPAGGIPTTSVKDARGNVVDLYQYAGPGPSGSADVTHYTYLPGGSLETVTDPLGNQWRYGYNQRKQRTLVEDPDSGDTTYTYDGAGNVTSTTDGRGIKLSHKYDDLGRKIETWQGDVSTGTKLSAWKYDTIAKGQLYYTGRYTPTGNYFVSYPQLDNLYRPLTTRYTIPSGDVGTQLGQTYDFTTSYNTDGTVRETGMPAAGGLAAESVVTTYNSLLRPTALTGTSSYVSATAYGNTGELLQMELYTGGTNKKAWVNWEYDRGTGRVSRSMLTRQGVPAVDLDAHYAYDDAGNVLSIADTPAGGARDVQCFGYDSLRRLTDAWATASTASDPCAGGAVASGVGGPAPYWHSWSFTKTGSRDVETIHGIGGAADTTRTYTYPAQGQGQNQPHAVSAVDESGPGGNKTYRYGYDLSGNTTCRPNAQATDVCPPGTPSGQQALTWDAEGHLATSTPAGGQATSYLYDAAGTRLVRKEPGATTLYLNGMELKLTGTTVSGTRHYQFAGKVVASRTSSGVSFQVADHHGTSSCSISAVSGALTWRRTTPHGAVRGTPPSSWPNEKGFVGGVMDTTTGLTHLGAREYDPALGRFVSRDPITDTNDPQQLHGYAYSNNNPISFSDADGLMLVADGGGGGGESVNTACDKQCWVNRMGWENHVKQNRDQLRDKAKEDWSIAFDWGYGEFYIDTPDVEYEEEVVEESKPIDIGPIREVATTGMCGGDAGPTCSLTEQKTDSATWSTKIGGKFTVGYKGAFGSGFDLGGEVNYEHSWGATSSAASTSSLTYKLEPGERGYIAADVSVKWQKVNYYIKVDGEKSLVGTAYRMVITNKGPYQVTVKPGEKAPGGIGSSQDLLDAVLARL